MNRERKRKKASGLGNVPVTDDRVQNHVQGERKGDRSAKQTGILESPRGYRQQKRPSR